MRARQPLELRQLRHFVMLAEELNFRRAAERLFITQPSLSHQIGLLEAGLGVRLFRRDRRGVSLTGAGKAILEDARRLLAESEAIVTTARRIADVDGANLRIGYPEFANRTAIPDIIAGFHRLHPEVRVQRIEGYSRKLLQDLRLGELDVAFMMLPAAEELGQLQVEHVIDEKAGLLLAANHRLADLEDIPIEALADEPLLLADRAVNPHVYDAIVNWFHGYGLEPRFFKVGGAGVYSYDTALRVIESGEAVSLSAESMLKALPPGVVFRHIGGSSPSFQMAAVWSPENQSVSLMRLLEVARNRRGELRSSERGVRLTA